tara:strand:- start:110 stop:508 length:399 start_codon:yes stop_codon:yes gene_type:complete
MVLSPNFKYTAVIDSKIQGLVEQHGKRWRFIASELGGELTDDAIRNRYMRINCHTPSPPSNRRTHSVTKRRPRTCWTYEEDMRLAHAIEKYGMKWNHIQDIEFPDKTRQALRNRAHRKGLKLLYLMSALEKM